jgi:hypothetical protein
MARSHRKSTVRVLKLDELAFLPIVAGLAAKQLRRRLALIRAALLLARFIPRPCPLSVEELMIAIVSLERSMRTMAETVEASVAFGTPLREDQCERELADCLAADDRLDRAIGALLAAMPEAQSARA